MATTQRKTLVYGNHRVTFLSLADQGEGDLEDLQIDDGPPVIGEASPIKESPILIEKIETLANIGMGGDPIWHEIEEFADLGELYSNVASLQQANSQLLNHNQQLSRQLGVFESRQQAELG